MANLAKLTSRVQIFQRTICAVSFLCTNHTVIVNALHCAILLRTPAKICEIDFSFDPTWLVVLFCIPRR